MTLTLALSAAMIGPALAQRVQAPSRPTECFAAGPTVVSTELLPTPSVETNRTKSIAELRVMAGEAAVPVTLAHIVAGIQHSYSIEADGYTLARGTLCVVLARLVVRIGSTSRTVFTAREVDAIPCIRSSVDKRVQSHLDADAAALVSFRRELQETVARQYKLALHVEAESQEQARQQLIQILTPRLAAAADGFVADRNAARRALNEESAAQALIEECGVEASSFLEKYR